VFEQSQWVWMDGEIVPWMDATLHVSCHGLHYGTGVFEGIRCYETDSGPAVFRLESHLQRFYASASTYGMQIPFAKDELIEGVCELIRQNGFSRCYVRPICYYGSKSLTLSPSKCPVHVSMLAWPWDSYLGSIGVTKGVHITVSRWTKFHSSMMPSAAKACGQYLNSILALREAVSEGYDEALLLDHAGRLCEGSGENIFLVKNKTLLTNDERHSILLGVTRDAVITIARDLGIKIEVRALTLKDLVSADEAFFTGTAAEVMPIRAVDGRDVGTSARGPVTEAIQRRFFAAVGGREPRYKKWLHFVAGAPSGESAVHVLETKGAE
jgi:branched-chain amino acid aminotransferase